MLDNVDLNLLLCRDTGMLDPITATRATGRETSWTDSQSIAGLNYFGIPIQIYSFISMLTISVLEFCFREHVKSKDKNKEQGTEDMNIRFPRLTEHRNFRWSCATALLI